MYLSEFTCFIKSSNPLTWSKSIVANPEELDIFDALLTLLNLALKVTKGNVSCFVLAFSFESVISLNLDIKDLYFPSLISFSTVITSTPLSSLELFFTFLKYDILITIL